MVRYTTRCLGVALAAFLVLVGLSTARADKKFLDSDDAKEHDEPQKFLPDYDKLVKGSDADWVYFPGGGGNMKSYKTVSVKEFDHNGHGRECRDAARDGKRLHGAVAREERASRWSRAARDLVDRGQRLQRVGAARSGARYWGGWAANPGVGLEIITKDSSGKVVGEMRHKSKGSTLRDAVENGLEDMTKSIAKGQLRTRSPGRPNSFIKQVFAVAGPAETGARCRLSPSTWYRFPG